MFLVLNKAGKTQDVFSDCCHKAYLQFILMVRVSIRQVPELLGQTETVLHVLRRYKIFCHFNAAVQVMDLKPPYRRTDGSGLNEPHKTPKMPSPHVRFFPIYLSETGMEAYLISQSCVQQ